MNQKYCVITTTVMVDGREIQKAYSWDSKEDADNGVYGDDDISAQISELYSQVSQEPGPMPF